LTGFLRHKRYLLTDRDSKHCAAFRELVEQAGPVVSACSPDREFAGTARTFLPSIKEECFDRIIFFGDRSRRNAAQEFISIIMLKEIIKASAIGSSNQPTK